MDQIDCWSGKRQTETMGISRYDLANLTAIRIRIIAALCNKYRPPLCRGSPDHQAVAVKIIHLSWNANSLQTRVDEEGLDWRSMRWTKVDADYVAPKFPRYDETDLREPTLGVNQLRKTRSYTQEHIDVDGKIEISVSDDITGILATFELLIVCIYADDKNMETRLRDIKRKMKSMKVKSGAGGGVFRTRQYIVWSSLSYTSACSPVHFWNNCYCSI